jgi:ATP-dependent nuclease subunit A
MSEKKQEREVSYTKEQQAVIYEKNKNILVSAAAGSGKTAVLVERILTIVEEERVDINRMLIVTFTNAAAGEMRERISKAFAKRLGQEGHNTAFLQEQMIKISEASISTLHSFCIDVLRQFFHAADISPSFTMATEANGSVLKAKSLEEVLEESYERGDEIFFQLVDAYGGNKSDKAFVELVNRIYQFIQGQPYPLKWLKQKSEQLDCSKEEFLQSDVMHFFLEQLRFELDKILASCEEGFRMSVRYDLPYLDNLEDDRLQIEKLKKSLEEGLDAFVNALETISFGRLKTVTKAQKESGSFPEDILNTVKEIRNQDIKKAVDNLKKTVGTGNQERYYQQMKNMAPLMMELYRFVERFSLRYQEKKKEQEILDFSDLEHLVLKLLEDDSIRQVLQHKYEYIFFDEYQDSNLVQETIIHAICRKNNLFFVGDMKQSIYGFRLAEPKLFHERYDNYKNSQNGLSVTIDLSKNFRSRKEILDFCNDIFFSLMTEQLGEIDYTQECQALVHGLEYPEQSDSVELCLCEKSEEVSAISYQVIAQKIQELQGRLWQNAKGEQKDLQYRDMVVLMRSPKNSAKELEQILKEKGIPCYVDYSSVGFEVMEIYRLLEYLRVIDNEMQDEALLGAMVSFFGGFREDELAEIRSHRREGSFYDAIQEYVKDSEDGVLEESPISSENTDSIVLKPILQQKVKDFFDKVQHWRKRERFQPLSEFLWDLVIETGYLNYNALLEKGEERTENIAGFIKKAEEYQSHEGEGLFGFLCYIDRILREKGDSLEVSALSESENVVRIMSIHKSKGLEFPVVFLADLQRQFYLPESRDSILLHNELGIGAREVNLDRGTYCDSLGKKVIQMKKKQEQLSEEVRILYVALTRAIDRLILVGEVASIPKFLEKVRSSNLTSQLNGGRSYLHWLTSILVRHFNGRALRETTENIWNEEQGIHGSSKFQVTYYTVENLREIEQLSYQTLAEKLEENCTEDIEWKQKLEQRFLYEYPHQEEVQRSYKKGVTQYIKEKKEVKEESSVMTKVLEEPFDKLENVDEEVSVSTNQDTVEEVMNFFEDHQQYRLPQFLQKEKPLNAARMGTLYHFVLQALPIQLYTKEELEKKLDELVVKELLYAEDRAQIDSSFLMRFFESDFGKRVVSADKVYREKPFMLKKDGYILEGIIDCYFLEKEKLILFDFKTDQYRNAEKHREQLELYAEALEKNYGRPVDEIYVVWLRYGTVSRLD